MILAVLADLTDDRGAFAVFDVGARVNSNGDQRQRWAIAAVFMRLRRGSDRRVGIVRVALGRYSEPLSRRQSLRGCPSYVNTVASGHPDFRMPCRNPDFRIRCRCSGFPDRRGRHRWSTLHAYARLPT